MPKSDRAQPSPPGPEVEPKVPSRRAVGDKPKASAKGAKHKAASRNATAKAVKKIDTPNPRATKRGTPKGKGTVKPKHGGRIGNPPFKATDEQRNEVISLVAAGAQHWIVARALQIGRKTLERHFPVELEHGKKLVDAKVGGAIARKALDGDPDMQKFYAARRAGWSTRTELSGPGGAPIEYRNLSDEELDARIAALSGNAAATAED